VARERAGVAVEPLAITATLWGRIILPVEGYVHLDALLAWAVCHVEGRPPALDEEQLAPVEIPVARSACDRYYLASASVSVVRERELRWKNKRFPVEWWQTLGGGKSARRVQTSAGPSKGFRVPVEAQHLEGDRLTWWCVGDRPEVERLLSVVTHVGRHRGCGEGEVRGWGVEPCEPWGSGFPVVDAEGQPLRHLPADEELVTGEHLMRIGVLEPPYWTASAEEPIVAPPRRW